MSSSPYLIGVEEAAYRLGVSVRTIYRWSRSGCIPVVRLGDRILFDPHDLRTWVEKKKEGVQVGG